MEGFAYNELPGMQRLLLGDQPEAPWNTARPPITTQFYCIMKELAASDPVVVFAECGEDGMSSKEAHLVQFLETLGNAITCVSQPRDVELCRELFNDFATRWITDDIMGKHNVALIANRIGSQGSLIRIAQFFVIILSTSKRPTDEAGHIAAILLARACVDRLIDEPWTQLEVLVHAAHAHSVMGNMDHFDELLHEAHAFVARNMGAAAVASSWVSAQAFLHAARHGASMDYATALNMHSNFKVAYKEFFTAPPPDDWATRRVFSAVRCAFFSILKSAPRLIQVTCARELVERHRWTGDTQFRAWVCMTSAAVAIRCGDYANATAWAHEATFATYTTLAAKATDSAMEMHNAALEFEVGVTDFIKERKG